MERFRSLAYFLTLLPIAIATACADIDEGWQKSQKLKVGMTRQEVENVLSDTEFYSRKLPQKVVNGKQYENAEIIEVVLDYNMFNVYVYLSNDTIVYIDDDI